MTLAKSYDTLNNSEQNILSLLKDILTNIKQLTKFFNKISDTSERLNNCFIELKDISNEIFSIYENINFNPSEINNINSRLELIYNLEKKHKVKSIHELLKVKTFLENKIENISNFDDKIDTLTKEIDKLKEDTLIKAKQISNKRLSVINKIERDILNILSELAIPDGIFKIEHKILDELTLDGIDKIKFLFSANKGIELRELTKIASGGELSRLMLSIKSIISQKKLLPTLIFDEIDTGISGDISAKVGNILKNMSNSMQIIAITHSPQIAAKANKHLKVYKEYSDNLTKSIITYLSEQERIYEIAKMLSNDTIPTTAAIMNAQELIKN
jgi:DNA repair protein RecN (Recombination protein N)